MPLWPAYAAARIEDFLSASCEPLRPEIPDTTLDEFRSVMRGHLEDCVKAAEERGALDDATAEGVLDEILRNFGNPKRIAKAWRRSWIVSDRSAMRRATWVAMACFGVAGLVWPAIGDTVRGNGASLMMALPIMAGFCAGLISQGRAPMASLLAQGILFAPMVAINTAVFLVPKVVQVMQARGAGHVSFREFASTFGELLYSPVNISLLLVAGAGFAALGWLGAVAGAAARAQVNLRQIASHR